MALRTLLPLGGAVVVVCWSIIFVPQLALGTNVRFRPPFCLQIAAPTLTCPTHPPTHPKPRYFFLEEASFAVGGLAIYFILEFAVGVLVLQSEGQLQ